MLNTKRRLQDSLLNGQQAVCLAGQHEISLLQFAYNLEHSLS